MNKKNRDIELKLQTSQIRQLFIKIEILDQTDKVIDEVSGSAIGGNYNIDASSAVRRTCSITFKLENGFLPDEKSVFWINKRFKLYIGLKQNKTNDINEDIYWFDKGVYAIKDPSISISISESTITINGLDKMALHNGDISGQLSYATMIDVEEGVYVHEAVKGIMLDGGETNLLITNTDLQIPHKIESSIGDMRYDVIQKLTDLFYNYQAYYNLDGYFVFEQKPMYQSNNNTITNDVVMDFSKNQKAHNLIISINREIAYSNVKNKIVVYGGVHDDGYQPSYNIIIDDNNENYSGSPYTIEKLGEKNSDGTYICRSLIIQDDTYVDDGGENSEGDITTILIPKDKYQFEMATKGNKQSAPFSQIVLPSYYEPDIPNANNAFGIANEQQCVYYDIIYDDTAYYNCVPKNYFGNMYYVGNVYILEKIMESGDYTEADDTGEPFVCWYDGQKFGIYIEEYTEEGSIKEYTVQLIRKETTNHAYSINLCKDRAKQEAYLHQQATDTVSITCLPIYSLDVNQVIYLDDEKSGAVGEYVINNISCGLGAGDTMTINANKLW